MYFRIYHRKNVGAGPIRVRLNLRVVKAGRVEDWIRRDQPGVQRLSPCIGRANVLSDKNDRLVTSQSKPASRQIAPRTRPTVRTTQGIVFRKSEMSVFEVGPKVHEGGKPLNQIPQDLRLCTHRRC